MKLNTVNFVNLIAVAAGLFFSGGGTLIRYVVIKEVSDFKSSLIITQVTVAIVILSVYLLVNCQNNVLYYLVSPRGIINSAAILILGMFVYFLGADNICKFHWLLVAGGFFFSIGLIAMYYILSNSDIISVTVLSRSSGLICGILFGIFLLRDFPKHLTQWVGMGIIMVGMIITLFSSR